MSDQEKKYSVHKPVLLQEVIEGLNIRDGGVYVDGTLGGGGHAQVICQSATNITIIGIDADQDALDRTQNLFESNKDSKCKTIFVQARNHLLDQILKDKNIDSVDGILLDLGMSSDQLDNSGRGFSFQKDEPLLMNMKAVLEDADLTAKEIVNTWEEDSISDILWGYGDEQFARRISKGIIESRRENEIKTTFDLVDIIEKAVPSFYKKRKSHPATKTFQALRITVNNEIENLKTTLEKGIEVLSPTGRIAVITFHSLEDRVVKRFFREKSKENKIILINKKPIPPNPIEIKNNPRARSAKLRIIEKI